jgi:hypothetical protein
MYKAFWQADPVGHLPAWTKGVAQQLALNTHVPILCDIAEKVVSLLERHTGTQTFDENKPWAARTVRTAPWDDVTAEWMCRRYAGLTLDMFERDRKVVAALERLPAVMHSEVVNCCVCADDL